MERPRLFEYPIYAVILGVAGAWIYGVPPFTHDPAQRNAADLQTGASTAEGERSTTLSGPSSRSERRSLARPGDDAAQTSASESRSERADLSESELGEQQDLDPQPNLLRVTASSLNMRAEPNASSPRVGSYPRGAVVEPVTTQGNWVLVRTLDDDATGWMYADYLGEVAEN